MRHHAALTLLVAGALLAGCTTTKQAQQAIESHYQGKPVDQFFLRYGPPAQQYKTQEGQTIFVWSSDPAGRSGGARPITYCELQLVADAGLVLRTITPRYDSLGAWTTSYCAELFK